MSIGGLFFIIPFSLYHGLRIRIRYWLKILALSFIILLISYLNFFVYPEQWNTHVKPYKDAKFDYMIDLSTSLDYTIYVSEELTSLNYTDMLLNAFRDYGVEVRDYVLISERLLLGTNLEVAILSDIGKIDLTEYNNIVWGRRPSNEEVIINELIFRKNVSIHDSKIRIGRGIFLSYSGVFLGRSLDMVMDATLYNKLFSKRPRYIDPFTFLGGDITIYIDFARDLDRDTVTNVVWDVIEEMNKSGLIKFEQMVSRDDILRSINYSIVSREEILSKMERYFEAEYLNPFSPFTISSVGALVIYIVYLIKVSFDIMREDLDIMALFYAVGGSDMHVALYILSTITIFALPPIILAFIASIYWIRIIYGLFLPYILIFEWLYPYIFTPFIVILISSVIISIVYIRRVGLSQILSVEF